MADLSSLYVSNRSRHLVGTYYTYPGLGTDRDSVPVLLRIGVPNKYGAMYWRMVDCSYEYFSIGQRPYNKNRSPYKKPAIVAATKISQLINRCANTGISVFKSCDIEYRLDRIRLEITYEYGNPSKIMKKLFYAYPVRL